MLVSTTMILTVLLLSLVPLAKSDHFRGGTISWQPTGVGYEVKLSFNSFKNNVSFL